MEIHCTRPHCPRPQNFFAELDQKATLQTAQQRYCTACGIPLILGGRYIPTQLLSQGGFSTTFLARDRHTPLMRYCVVKQFQPSDQLSPVELAKAQELFEQEAEVLEKLGNNHPQIPNLYAFFPLNVTNLTQPDTQDQFFYLVQEFIDGQDLAEELKTKGTFSETEVMEIFREMLDVLKFVHEHDSIHRDIKPSNIMRHRNGRLYLLDFGAVKQVATSAKKTSSTGIYTPGYAPREQMQGQKVFQSSDLYALAVTLIVLLTGKEPQDLRDFHSNIWHWRQYTQVSDTLTNVLDQMLLETPSERFQSAQEVIDALNSPSVSPPTQTSPPPHSPISPSPPISKSLAIQPRSLSEIFAEAAFIGFECGLLFMLLKQFLGFSGITVGLVGMAIGGLVYGQYYHRLKTNKLLTISGISLAVLLIPLLMLGWSILELVITGGIASASAIAITALFRLMYLLLSRLLGR
ncbi:protein kinase domain-containing protein [Coleofasciculus chthonoplastes]|uniref:protein kinase domain-containing protein n=1 Tax=Coleofasciculus chthonoplastes TaxID=64178 RepID=UPI0032F98EEE